jgi:hypothetical protein
MARFSWKAQPGVTLDPEYASWLEASETIVVNDLVNCQIPKSVTFPNATTLVAVDWEKNAVCWSLHPQHFPSVTTVEWLSPRLCSCHGNDARRFGRWVVPERSHVASQFYVQTPECAACNPYTVAEDAGLRARYLRGGEEPREEEVLVHKWMPRKAAGEQFWAYCAAKQATEVEA